MKASVDAVFWIYRRIFIYSRLIEIA